MWDPGHLYHLHLSSQRRWMSDPLRKARDRTCVLMDTSWVCFCWATMGTPRLFFLHRITFTSLSKIRWAYVIDLFLCSLFCSIDVCVSVLPPMLYSLFFILNEFYYIYRCTTIITTKFYSISIPNLQCIPPPLNLSPLESTTFSKSVSQYLFCKEVRCVLFSDSTSVIAFDVGVSLSDWLHLAW